MPVRTYKELMAEFRLDFDGYDPWGSTISWLFRLCDSLVFDHNLDAPPECQFRPSPAGPANEPDEYPGALLPQFDPQAVYKAARVLNRYGNMLRRAGLDY